MKSRIPITAALLAGALPQAQAAKIGDLFDADWLEQAGRFWSLQDTAVQHALLGSILMGTCCGLLGAFFVVRKLSLAGDTLSHAVMPGIALGFLWAAGKDPWSIFIGAVLVGLLGMGVVSLLRLTPVVKEDGALGMVLSGFYAVGICLFVMIQRTEMGNKSGIDHFLFGQAAALSTRDLNLMAAVTLLVIAIIAFCYKELLVTSFDLGFAKAIGIRTGLFQGLLMLLLTFAVVVSIQAAGVVLVSALLIIPPATAYLLTDRMGPMLALSVLFGIISGVLGCFFSFLGHSLPTGPFMVVGAASLFFTALFLAPRHGILPRFARSLAQRRRVQLENTLKAVYHTMEAGGFGQREVALADIARLRNESLPETESRIRALLSHKLASAHHASSDSRTSPPRSIILTPGGFARAREIVRNHRIWELYLTHAADYESDHVHDDAERVEHLLNPETVKALEARLNFPEVDPHGRPIPLHPPSGNLP